MACSCDSTNSRIIVWGLNFRGGEAYEGGVSKSRLWRLKVMEFDDGLVMTVAEGLLAEFERAPVKWRGTLFVWDKGRWKKRDDQWLHDWIMVKLAGATYKVYDRKGNASELPIDVTRGKVADVAAGLKALVGVEGAATPLWLGQGPPPLPIETSVCLEDVVVPLAGGEPVERTDIWFDPVVVPVTWGAVQEASGCPVFERCLEQWGKGCPVWREVVLRSLAYGLIGSRRYAKAILYYGTGRGGKGTLDKLEKLMMGGAGRYCTRLEEVVHPHGLQGMELARVVVVQEFTNVGGNQVGRTFRSVMKSLLGEDEIAVNPKGKPIFSCRVQAVPKILSNELPKIEDQYGSFWGKVVLVPFMESFLGREDIELIDKLEKEIPAIVGLVLDAGKRLVAERGKFPTIPEAEKYLQAAKAEANPIEMFLQLRCEEDGGSRVGRGTLKRAYDELRVVRPWLKLPTMTDTKFTQAIMSSGWRVDQYRYPVKEGNIRGFKGLKLVDMKEED